MGPHAGLSGPSDTSIAAMHLAGNGGTGRSGAPGTSPGPAGGTVAIGSVAGITTDAAERASSAGPAASREAPPGGAADGLAPSAGTLLHAAEAHETAAGGTGVSEPCGGLSAGMGLNAGFPQPRVSEQPVPDSAAAGPPGGAAGAESGVGFDQRIAMTQRAAEGAALAAADAAAAAAAAEQGAWRRRRQLLAEAEAASADRARAAAAEASAAEREVHKETLLVVLERGQAVGVPQLALQ